MFSTNAETDATDEVRPRRGNPLTRVLLGLRKKVFAKQKARSAHRKALKYLSSEERKLYQLVKKNIESIGFYPAVYLRHNLDVTSAGIDPLFHFIKYGQHERREPTFFFSTDWHIEMNDLGDSRLNSVLLHLAKSRSDTRKKKVAFFAYAWNAARLPDAYISEMITTLAAMGFNVDVYIAGHFAQGEATRGFRSDLKKADMGTFLRSQSYDFAISFNNALVLPETVDALDCKIVSVIVDNIHHLFDHTDEGLHSAFALPIHVAPIYTALIDDTKKLPEFHASTSFLPAATRVEGRGAKQGQEPIEISWIATMLGDHNLDSFMARFDELPNGPALLSRCLAGIEEAGAIGQDRVSWEAARKLCDWAQWDYPLLEMHLQEVVTNASRLAVVEKLAPLGLRIFGNSRWRTAFTFSPNTARSFRSGANLRCVADLCDIYDRSKISINIPQVDAGTGMQYRILDILASKSLLITRHVPNSDLERLFGADSPIVTFTNIDDLHAKCAYYLEHEDERLARVAACNAMVANGFSFRERVLEYLALSNPLLAGQIGDPTGPGSVTLIWPERVIEWANVHHQSAA